MGLTFYDFNYVADLSDYPYGYYDAVEVGSFIYTRSNDYLELIKIDGSDGSISVLDSGKGTYYPFMWHDRTNNYLYFSVGDDIYYLDYGNSDSITPIGSIPTGRDIKDIFKIGSDVFVRCEYVTTGAYDEIYKWVDPNWVLQDSYTATTNYAAEIFYGTVIGTKYYYFSNRSGGGMIVMEYNNSTTTISLLQEDSTYVFDSNQTLSAAYDNDDVLYVRGVKTGPTYHLVSYTISTNTLTVIGNYEVTPRSDRFTDNSANPPFDKEKLFGTESGVNDLVVYQIPTNYSGKLLKISNLSNNPNLTSASIHTVTDTYLIINNNGTYELWKYQDRTKYIIGGLLTRERLKSYGNIKVIKTQLNLEKNVIMRFYGQYTASSGGGSTKLCYSLYVSNIENKTISEVTLKSYLDEIDHRFPTGDYSGRSDEIISNSMSDECSYVTPGTLSNGEAMGTLTYKGKKSIKNIIQSFEDVDGFIGYFLPNYSLDYNNGTVDSGADIRWDKTTYTDTVWDVIPSYPSINVNTVTVYGAFDVANGTRYSGTASDAEDLTLNGPHPFYVIDSTLNSNAKCATAAAAILARDLTNPQQVAFTYDKPTVGVVQVGETITFLYNDGKDIYIASDQFIANKMIWDIGNNVGRIECSDGIIRSELKDKDQEQDEIIDQISDQVSTNIAKSGPFGIIVYLFDIASAITSITTRTTHIGGQVEGGNGWYILNGQTTTDAEANGASQEYTLPDLITDNRFMRSNSTQGLATGTGGQANAYLKNHDHDFYYVMLGAGGTVRGVSNNSGLSFKTSTEGDGDGVNGNLPPYKDAIPIIKIW